LAGALFEVVQGRLAAKKTKAIENELPADMSTVSLLGGGLIAGDALAALSLGLLGLVKVLFR
jgi:hypothetical protein